MEPTENIIQFIDLEKLFNNPKARELIRSIIPDETQREDFYYRLGQLNILKERINVYLGIFTILFLINLLFLKEGSNLVVTGISLVYFIKTIIGFTLYEKMKKEIIQPFLNEK